MMWCDIPEIRQRLGNALDCEHPYTGILQSFEQGFALRTEAGVAFIFFDDGTWIQQ
jgi:hypothetical protein